MNIPEISTRLALGVWQLWCARHEGRPDAGPLAYLEGSFDMLECLIPQEVASEFDQVRGSVNEVIHEMEKSQEMNRVKQANMLPETEKVTCYEGIVTIIFDRESQDVQVRCPNSSSSSGYEWHEMTIKDEKEYLKCYDFHQKQTPIYFRAKIVHLSGSLLLCSAISTTADHLKEE